MLIKTLEESTERFTCGTKAANLAYVYSSDRYKVPKGVVLSTSFYRALFNKDIQPDINTLVSKCDYTDIGQILETSHKISLFSRQIRQSLYEIQPQGLNKPWAIRSSNAMEDLDKISFAGVYKSFTGVYPVRGIHIHIKHVHASLYSPIALQYRHKHKVQQTDLTMPVIIQEYIKGHYSGVLFTRHPDTSDDLTYIETAEGNCENIVSGAVVPNVFLVKNAKVIDSKVIDSKVIPYAFYPSNEILYRLEAIGKELEDKFQKPLDIEWTVKDDQIYLLQVRPITVLPRFELQKPTGKSKAILTGNAIRSLYTAPIVKGRAFVFKSINGIDDFRPGDILVCDNTTEEMEPLMMLAGGLITNHGVRTSHAAIRSREYGLPAIVGTLHATDKIRHNLPLELRFNENPYKGNVYDG